MRDPITVTDVMASRIISAPLRLLDCCLISDGGAAIIVSARDAARDLRQPPVLLLGAGQQHTHEHIVASGSLTADRKSVVYGKSVSVRVDLGGRRISNKKHNQNSTNKQTT